MDTDRIKSRFSDGLGRVRASGWSKRDDEAVYLLTTAINNAISIRNMIEKTAVCYQLCNPFKVEKGLLTDNDIERNRTLIEKIYDFLEGDLSKDIFIENLNYKLTGNMFPLVDMVTGSNELLSYFDDELFDHQKEHIYIDIGAYTGDSIMSFLMATSGVYKNIYACEEDKGNYKSLVSYQKYARIPQMDTIFTALWSENEEKELFSFKDNSNINYDSPNLFTNVINIADNRTVSKACKENKEMEHMKIYTQTMDELFVGIAPTIIKVNAMASDMKILFGGKNLIKQTKPEIICEFGVRKEDIFKMIPWIQSLNIGYKFYLREKKIYHDIKTILYMK